MKIVTQLFDDNDNVLAKIETLSFEFHEEEMYKIEKSYEQEIENAIDEDLLNNVSDDTE